MRSLRCVPVLNTGILNKPFIRNVTVQATVEKVSEDSQKLKSWKEIPGPSSLPLIGQIHHFLPGGEFSNFDNLFDKLAKAYGPIVRLDGMLGSQPIITLFDPETMAYVLRSENWMPVRPGFTSLEYYRKHYSKNENSPALTGLITDHGDPWKQFRSAVNPVMLQPKTIKLYSTALDEVAQDMIVRLKSIRDDEDMIKEKFVFEMNLWALESIAVVALGRRLNCFAGELPREAPERKLIQCVNDIFTMAEKLDWRPSLWRYFSTPTFKKAMKLYEEQLNLAKHFIQEAKLEMEAKNTSDPEKEKGVLEKLLKIDENIAVIMASDMLFAGVDTASNTITTTLYLLAINPEKQNRLREELKTKEDRKYLKACIKEGMRMMPVVTGNLRQSTKDYDILGYHVPKGMLISFSHSFASMDEKQFPRAKEYLPERWIVDKENPLYYGNAHPFAYSPFGFGVRSCIGRRIAELEIATFLARLIENFKVEWSGAPMKTKLTTLNYVLPPFNFKFRDL